MRGIFIKKSNTMKHMISIALYAAGCWCSAGVSAADDTAIGFVKTVQGSASLVVAGQSIPATPGTALARSTMLKTGRHASMGVTLIDNTMLSIGPDTELALDEFLFEPAQGQLRLDARMLQGTLNYVSGVMAKLRPQAVTVHTPTGNIGVRGTHFVLSVSKE